MCICICICLIVYADASIQVFVYICLHVYTPYTTRDPGFRVRFLQEFYHQPEDRP